MSNNIINLFLILLISSISIYSQNVNNQKFQLGKSYYENGMLKEAELIFDELHKSEINNSDYFFAYIEVMKKQSKYSELIPIAETFYKNNKNTLTSNLLAELYWRNGKSSEANNMWDEAIKSNSNNKNTYVLVSSTQIKLRIFDKAINTLKIGRQNLNDSFVFSDELIKLYISTTNYKDGFEEILNGLKSNLNIATAQGRLYAFMINEQANEYLNDGLKKLANSNTASLGIQELYAWFLRTIKKYDDALEIYVRLDELKKTNGYELINFATTSLNDGQYDIAMKAYEIVIKRGKKNPYYSNALYGLTMALDRKLSSDDIQTTPKELNEIIDKYNIIIEEFPNSNQAQESYYRIATIYGEDLSNYSKAIEYLKELNNKFKSTPQVLNGLLYLGRIYLIQDNITEARNTFRKVIELNRIPNSNQIDEANYQLALTEYYLGNFDAAKEVFQKISTNFESNAANDALQKINFLDENKNFVEPLKKFALAEFNKVKKNYDESLRLFVETSKSAEHSPLGEESLFQASKIQFILQKYNECRIILNQILSDYPQTLRADEIYYNIAESFYIEKNEPEALKQYIELLSKFPNSIYLNDSRKKIRILRNEKI